VIVDQAFVDSVMLGRNPIGHRVRIGTRAQIDSNVADLPRYEIVGVVKDLGMSSIAMPQRWAGVYLPSDPGSQNTLKMIVHTRGDPMSIAPRVRELAMTVDASLRVEQATRLDQMAASQLWMLGLWTRIILGLTAVALVLSLAGIYAVLSYIVARRTRRSEYAWHWGRARVG
jgi:putative ABC transport system permease protein